MSGLSPAGFEGKSTIEIRDEIASELRVAISPSLNVEADSVLGHMVGIIADQLALAWELAQDVYASQYPDTATGASLDQVAAITGVQRLPAMRSLVTITAKGDEGTALPAGRVVSVEGTGARFRTLVDAVIGATGSVDIRCESEETGPIQASSRPPTLTKIETPVVGWDSVTNPNDAELGRNVETDLELRTRRQQLLRALGAGTLEALRAGLLDVPRVTSVTVFENVTIETVDGMRPKSFEVVVEGGDSQAILDAIWRLKPAGILAEGKTEGEVEDSQGIKRKLRFTRATPKRVYLLAKLRVSDEWPEDGIDRVKDSIVQWGQGLQLGESVIYSRVYGPIFHVGGIADVVDLEIGLSPGSKGKANLPIGARDKATIAKGDIEIEVIS